MVSVDTHHQVLTLFLGICMRQKAKYDRDALHFAPFVLFPSPFPRDEFNKAVNIQVIINELMHKVSDHLLNSDDEFLSQVAHDYNFLRESLKNTIKVDDFTGRLWKIYQTIMDEGGPTQVRRHYLG